MLVSQKARLERALLVPYPLPRMRRAYYLLLAAVLISVASAVKFDLTAATPANVESTKRCLSQYVTKDTLVFATVNVGPGYNQRVDLEARC